MSLYEEVGRAAGMGGKDWAGPGRSASGRGQGGLGETEAISLIGFVTVVTAQKNPGEQPEQWLGREVDACVTAVQRSCEARGQARGAETQATLRQRWDLSVA